jgi:hypothetical protein
MSPKSASCLNLRGWQWSRQSPAANPTRTARPRPLGAVAPTPMTACGATGGEKRRESWRGLLLWQC